MKNIRYALETAVVKSAVWLLPKLPHPFLFSVSRGLGAIAYWLDAKGRETAHENLRVAFPGELTPEQTRRIAMGSYQTFALTFLDLFWSSRLTAQNYRQYIQVHFDDPNTVALSKEKGAMWVTPHFGSFEMMTLTWPFRGLAMSAVAQDFKNPDITKIFRDLRESSGNTIISQDGAMVRLVKNLSKGGHTGLLTDLNIKPGRMAAALNCFGLQTCVTALHAHLAKRLEVPIIAGVCVASPGGYRGVVHKPLLPQDFETPKQMAQAVWDQFEQDIRETPEAWMWMYKHWRYLPGKDNDRDPAYPLYANALKAFRDLMGEK